MFISQPPCGDACIFESSAATGSHISTNAGVPADSQTATGRTCESTGIEQSEQCRTSLIDNSSQLQSPTSISSSSSEVHNTSLSPLLPRPEMGVVSSTCVSTQDAVGPQPFDTSDAKPHAYATAMVQCANTHQPNMLVCAAGLDKQHSPAAAAAATAAAAAVPSAAAAAVPPAAAAASHQQGHQVHHQQQGQQIGILRKKPGRGEPTLSMSCSDKVARWGLLGLQVLVTVTVAMFVNCVKIEWGGMFGYLYVSGSVFDGYHGNTLPYLYTHFVMVYHAHNVLLHLSG